MTAQVRDLDRRRPPCYTAAAALAFVTVFLTGCSPMQCKPPTPPTAHGMVVRLPNPQPMRIFDVTWNSQATAVVGMATYADPAVTQRRGSEIVLLSREGQSRRLTSGYWDSQPDFDPSGTRVVFCRGRHRPTRTDAEIGNGNVPNNPMLTRDQVLAASERRSDMGLCIVSVADGTCDSVATTRLARARCMAPQWVSEREISTVCSCDGIWRLCVLPATPQAAPESLLSSQDALDAVIWAPDGTRVIVTTISMGAEGDVVRSAMLGGREAGDWRPLGDGCDLDRIQWCHDSRSVCLRAGGEWQQIDVVTGHKVSMPHVTAPDGFYLAGLDWSPDLGAAVLVGRPVARGASGQTVFLRGSDGSTRQVYEGYGIRDVEWSPDGRWVAVSDQGRIVFVPARVP